MISLRFGFPCRRLVQGTSKRFFLSNAYKCEEAWTKRLRHPAFRKTDFNNLYHELDLCFQRKQRVSVLDVDLLLNGVRDESFKNELDDVLLRIRSCPEVALLPERATHAAIRWYIQHASTADLLNTLSDRLNYGLFPDHYLTNMLMDKYLKEGDPRSAVKIAVLQMLQEDLDHPITKAMAVHCCYNYLECPEVWESYKEPEPDPDEDVTKIRVKYMRNPYHDDHFDITDTNHLVGKTLWLFGRTMGGEIAMSSQLVGLVLYEKFKECTVLLEDIIKKQTKLHAEAVEKAREYCLVKPKQVAVGDGEAKDQETAEKVESEPVDQWKNKVLELLGKLEKKNLVSGNLLAESTQLVQKAVEENESNDIKHQCQIYEQWEKDRENHIQSEIEKARLAKLKKDIEKMKENLEKEEEKLFFFDREEEIQLRVQEKEKQKRELVFFRGKGKQKEGAMDYVPPVHGRSQGKT